MILPLLAIGLPSEYAIYMPITVSHHKLTYSNKHQPLPPISYTNMSSELKIHNDTTRVCVCVAGAWIMLIARGDSL